MLLLVLAVLFAVVLTWLLWPFWNWLEHSYGIESVGHSGPVDWCYWVTLGVTVCLLFGFRMIIWRMWK